MPTNDELVRYFCQHLVPVSLLLQRENDSQNPIITSFVLSVNTHWFLVTAGHWFEEIDDLVNKHGYRIVRSYLFDSLGLYAKHAEPIPFDFKDSFSVSLSSQREFDYGVIELTPYYQELLLANNVHPLNEEAWKNPPPNIDFYMLLGVPSEFTKVEEISITLTAPLINIKPLDTRPEGFPETDFPVFYGRAILGNSIKSIGGMSGGPIFGFYRNNRNELRYWVIALQSRWLPISHYIMACPTNLLGLYLEHMIEGWEVT
jgi:hypothetical protein